MSEIAPKNGEFQDGKLWFQRKGKTVTLGLTNSAIEDVGDIEGIEFPSEEDDFDKGDVVVTIEGTKGSFEVTTPAAGVILEINETVRNEPTVVTEDPLEEGWLVKVEVQDTSDLKEFAGAED